MADISKHVTRNAQRETRNVKLVVTMAAAEIVPFAKTGGLADMVAALSSSLAESGVTVNMVLPAYRRVIRDFLTRRRPVRTVQISISGQTVTCRLYRKRLGPKLTIFFVRADEYFDREGYYGDACGDFADNAERFAFFCRAVLEVAGLTGSRIIHLHDWQAAPAAAMLRLQPERYPQLAGAGTVLTIHNLAYQGLFDSCHWPALDLNPAYFNPNQFEFYGKVNFLKSGLVNARRLTTVSPTYALEVQDSGGGFGLEGVLSERLKDLSGILNGVDYAIWNPETDVSIASQYSTADLSGKRLCKLALQENCGLHRDAGVPLICMVTRLTDGKGLDLVMEVIDSLLGDGVQFVMLGSGQRRFEEFFSALACRFPGRAAVRVGFDEALAHRTIAGADILLMPSQYEPCGLTQMYALKYGTVPVVRRTGGLADSIVPYDPTSSQGDGFVFSDYRAVALLDAVHQTLKAYRDKDEWSSIVRRGMAADHSWTRSTEVYLSLYHQLLSRPT